VLVSLFLVSCGGGGDGGGTAPPTVASVAISGTLPALFQTVGRTAQLTATARDAAGATIPGVTISWISTVPGVATVSSTGVVTAVGNGTTVVRASAGGINSPDQTVTVTQFAASIGVTPGTVAFGAIGATRQLAGAVVDSGGAPVAGAAAPSWTRAGTGATASVSPTGLATALAVGATDTAVAAAAGLTQRVPISVTQVVASIALTTSGADTLATTGRTKQYAGVPRDSLNNTIPGAAVTWSSSAPAVASVGSSTGLATAVADGVTNIIATSGSITAQRALTVRRFASTFQMNPNAATITTSLGSQVFTASAQDSVATNLPIAWASRNTSIATLSGSSGTSVTATAAGNGSTYIVMTAGTRADSAQLTVSGQTTAPLTASVTVGDFFFRSVRNATQDPLAIDTVAVGGTVTWNFTGAVGHNVTSSAAPSFTGSSTMTSGTHVFTFGAAGAYNYMCTIHPSMQGRVVVR